MIQVINLIKFIFRCKENLERVIGAPWRMITGFSDIYYVPRHMAEDFITINNIFIDHKVFMDVAVLTSLAALSEPGNTVEFDAN